MLVALEQITFLLILNCDNFGIVCSSWFHSCCKWVGSNSSHCDLSRHNFCRDILYSMRAGLSSLSGSKMDDVIASTLRFVPAVESDACIWVKLLLTCSWSFLGFHSNPSVVTPSSLSRDNVDCVSCSSFGMVSKNVEWLDVHFLNVSPAVWSRDDIYFCILTASSMVEVLLSKLST